MLAAAKSDPWLFLAYVLYTLWICLAIQGQSFFGAALETRAPGRSLGWLPTEVASIAAFLAMGAAFKLRRWTPGRRDAPAAGLAIFLGSVACLMSGALDSPGLLGAALFYAGSILVGSGVSVALVSLGALCGALGLGRAIWLTALVFLCSAASMGVVSFLPLEAQRAAVTIAALGMAWSFRRATASKPDGVFTHGRGATSGAPVRLILISLLLGFGYGVARGVEGASATGGALDPVLVNAVGYAAAVLAFFVTALFFKMDFNHLIYRIGAVAVAVGLLLDSPALVSVAYWYCDLVKWVLYVYLIDRMGFASVWAISLANASLLVGQVAGALVGEACASVSAPAVSAAEVAAAFVLVVGSLYLIDSQDTRDAWGLRKPGADTRPTGALDLAIEELARRYALTPRETDVFALQARGHSRRAIADSLSVADETVKGHIKSVYAKTGLHSRQEVVDAAQALARQIEREGER